METAFELLSPGRTLMGGRYEIMRCLQAGGMGAVYEAFDRETQRRRALKTMLPSVLSDSDLRDRFHLEATVTAEIESEHIVQVFDAGIDHATGLPFLVMELLRGETLAELLARRVRLESSEVVLLLHQASLGLSRTHAAGIVHRDLKPENLFLAKRDDGSPWLKLLDFGIAKVAAAVQPGTTRSLGSPLYMAPEQIRGDGDIGPRADLYSVGQLAFTLLVGHPYWAAESQRVGGLYRIVLQVMDGAREPASVRAQRYGVTLPPAFDVWFLRATARAPEDRFADTVELAQALAVALGCEAPSERFLRSSSPALPNARRRRRLLASGLAGAILLVMLAMLFARSRPRPGAEASSPTSASSEARARPLAASRSATAATPTAATTASGTSSPRIVVAQSSRSVSKRKSVRRAVPTSSAAKPITAPAASEPSTPQDPSDQRR